MRASQAVAAGEAIFGPGAAADPFPELTPPERQVLELLAGGLTTTAIGARLGLAPKTVTNHPSAVFAKPPA